MRLLWVVLLTAAIQVSAAPVLQREVGSVEGAVLGPGDRPISGAEVSALLVPTVFGALPARAFSDTSGRFTFPSLAAGSYRLSVIAPGYARQEFGAATSGRRGQGTGTIIDIASGRPVRNATVRLIGNGIISGRITGPNGQPLLGIEVNALLKVHDETGGMALLPDNEAAKTNDRGEYRVAGLTPGRYYVRASMPIAAFEATRARIAQNRGEPAPPDPSPGTYAATYYPGVHDPGRAADLEIQAGIERRNVDFSLPRPQLYRIRGRVVDPGATRIPAQLSFTVVPRKSEVVRIPDMFTIPVQADGTFELTGIATGDYWVTAVVPPGSDFARGYSPVKVLDGDAEEIQITLLRKPVISGRIELEGASNVRLDSTRIELRAGFVPGQAGPPLGDMKMSPDGTFTFSNFPVLEHRLAVLNLPRDLFVKEARFGDIDAMAEPMQINRVPTPELHILLARGVEVSGSVTDRAGRAVSSQQVVLVPDRISNRPDFYKTAITGSNGRFAIPAVPPGDYKVFAWRTLEPFRYFDREFVRSFETQGTPLSIGDTPRAAVDVRLIP